MNEVLDAETAELLKSMEAEGETVETPTETPVEAEPQTVETPEAVEVPSQEQKVEEVHVPVDRVPKEPTLMPKWEHKIAEKKWEKEREQLTQEIEAMRAKPIQQQSRQDASTIREMAQQYGLELNEGQEAFFQTLISQASSVPEQLTKKLEALEQDRQVAYLETQYENEFLKDVAPLLAEVPAEQHTELKRKLHNLAFSEQYAKVPLKKVFLAEQDTLNVTPARHKLSMDTTKQGKSRTVVTDYSNLSEDDVSKLSPEEFEKYADSMEGKSKWLK